MKFAKTLVAAALLAGATGAQASQLSATGAFLQVYDSVKAATYDLNLEALNGLNESSLLTSGNLSIDLSKDANWTSFSTGLSATTTVWGVAAAATASAIKGDYVVTSRNSALTKYTNLGAMTTSQGAITDQVGRINVSLVGNSVVVADAVTNQGGWALDPTAMGTTFDNLWGTKSDTAGGIAYGSTGNFFNVTGTQAKSGLKFVLTETDTLLGTWNLTGNTLSFTAASAPAAVPLPAAVWMFGAGLMGFLGMTRRKSAAV